MSRTHAGEALRILSLASLAVLSIGAEEPPTVPPPVVLSYCNTGPYIIFFASSSAVVEPEAEYMLQTVIKGLADCRNPAVTLNANIDATENARIGIARARSVHSYFIEAGVAPADIELVDNGNRRPLVPGSRAEVQNRNVQIVIAER